ncbi:MAG: hypothetical protein IT374_03650 [Polyangiaceae bacterium]|nr:hypothetical protein [Polyangiaceae bacterium]
MRASTFCFLTLAAAACASGAGDEAPDVISGGTAGATATAGAGGDGGEGGEGGASLPDGGAFPDAASGVDGAAFPDAASAGAPGTGGAGGQSGGEGGQSAAGEAGQAQAGAPSGPCAGLADGAVCAPTSSPCKDPGVCAGGACTAITNKANGTVCDDPKSPCQTPGVCSSGACGAPKDKPDETVPDSSKPYTRCCGGVATNVTTSSRCGSCSIKCNGSNGESCEARSSAGQTHYYCAGCVASAACWSGCCSTSYAATKNVCAASDCKGGCTSKCPSGTHCKDGTSYMMSNWCEPN